ncbi:MAG: glycosyl hydrolase-related protein, partial [Planctomycetales bacterium]|nr:glycosyl hydrolase-related protein [Planctomycetales bacterium]
ETVELINTTDKLKERRQEGVYFEYPLNIPDGISKIDIPWAVCQPEKDQLPAANRNYYCVQRWVDISNNDYGLTWVTVDAPMLQFDPILLPTIGWPSLPHEWRTEIKPGQHFYSWVMNNHWETNYKADQEGLITFKYALKPHIGKYDPVKAQQFGRSVHQPLIAVCSNPSKPVAQSMFTLDNDGVVVTSVKPSRDGQDLMIRLFNTTDSKTKMTIDFPHAAKAVWISNPREEKIKKVRGPISMVKHEIVTLRVQ